MIREQLQRSAQRAVEKAIAGGRLKPAGEHWCKDCEWRKASEYHHWNGYGQSALLDVIPLCDECHKKRHPNRRGTPSRNGRSVWRSRSVDLSSTST